MARQAEASGDDGVARWDLNAVDRSMDEVRRGGCQARHRQQFRRGIDPGYFKPGLEESFPAP